MRAVLIAHPHMVGAAVLIAVIVVGVGVEWVCGLWIGESTLPADTPASADSGYEWP